MPESKAAGAEAPATPWSQTAIGSRREIRKRQKTAKLNLNNVKSWVVSQKMNRQCKNGQSMRLFDKIGTNKEIGFFTETVELSRYVP